VKSTGSSGVSGPTQGTFETRGEQEWKARVWAGRAVNVAVHGGPIVLASAVGLVVARLLPKPSGLGWIGWIAAVLVASQLTLKGSERAVRRLLPLSALLRFSLVFPDQAPSRFALTLRSGSVEKLRRAAERAAADGLPSDLNAAARTALTMVAQLNRHDRGTRGHSERVRAYSEMLAEELGLDRDFRERLRWGALLHDMGKLTVPSEILNKPGRPTEEEWKILSGHPAEGARILQPLAEWLGDAVHAAGQHHERYDGKGYPQGLQGEEISLSARIVAVADAFAVMTGARAYKKPLPLEVAREELTKNAGTQFDPVVVRAMLSVSISRVNRAAGPMAALANAPLIGSLLSGTAAIPAAVSSGAAAAVLTAASLVTPVSPVEWISPDVVAAPPAELAFTESATEPMATVAEFVEPLVEDSNTDDFVTNNASETSALSGEDRSDRSKTQSSDRGATRSSAATSPASTTAQATVAEDNSASSTSVERVTVTTTASSTTLGSLAVSAPAAGSSTGTTRVPSTTVVPTTTAVSTTIDPQSTKPPTTTSTTTTSTTTTSPITRGTPPPPTAPTTSPPDTKTPITTTTTTEPPTTTTPPTTSPPDTKSPPMTTTTTQPTNEPTPTIGLPTTTTMSEKKS
jgi:putative nucleotidyltransferase with HDIG domain